MAHLEFNDLSQLREQHKNERIVFASGTFDLTHAGHALFFEDCKKHGDILVVMVAPDAIIKRDKSIHRPVWNEHMRLKMVDSLKPVDYTFLDSFINIDWPKVETLGKYFEILRPDVYIANNDAWQLDEREALAKKHGVQMVVLERTCPPEFENVSTTGIIARAKEVG